MIYIIATIITGLVLGVLIYFDNKKKKESVKVFYVGVDKGVKVRYIKPENETISFMGKSYFLSHEKMFYHKGIASIFVNYKNAETLDLLDLKKIIFTADDYNTAISSKVGAEMFEASKPKEVLNLTTILLILVVVGIGFLWYSTTNELATLQQTINQLNEIITGVK